MRQCREVWLKECRLWHGNAHPIIQRYITITLSKVIIGGDPDWGVISVTSSKEENAAGFHQDALSVICEEASGIPREIITTFKGTLSNKDSLLLLIGNPNDRDCALFDCFHRQRHEWKCITLNAEDTARDYPHIVSPERNRLLADEFGRDSDVYRVRVLGEFPHVNPNTILSSEEVEHCVGDTTAEHKQHYYRCIQEKRGPEFGGGLAKQIGIDFARFGGDENIIYRRSGNAIVEQARFVHTEPLIVLRKAFEMQLQAGWKDADTMYVPDANGMGEGMMIHLYEAGKNVIEFKNQCSAVDDQYENIITEAWFNFRKLVRAKKCHIPNDNQLIQQLCGRRYTMTNKGKIIIEKKDDYKERHDGMSPDRADALVMAFYDQIYAVGHFSTKANSEHTVGAKVSLR